MLIFFQKDINSAISNADLNAIWHRFSHESSAIGP
jgi:hypothetical protein